MSNLVSSQNKLQRKRHRDRYRGEAYRLKDMTELNTSQCVDHHGSEPNNLYKLITMT